MGFYIVYCILQINRAKNYYLASIRKKDIATLFNNTGMRACRPKEYCSGHRSSYQRGQNYN